MDTTKPVWMVLAACLLLTLMQGPHVQVIYTTDFASVTEWSRIEGNGTLAAGGLLQTPDRVTYAAVTPPFTLQGCQLTIGLDSLNASAWSLLFHVMGEASYASVLANETSLGGSYEVTGDFTADGVALQALTGSADFANLTLAAALLGPAGYLDWLLLSVLPPWVIPAGAALTVLAIVLLLIIPHRKGGQL